MPVVSVTRLRLRSARFLPPFIFHSMRAANQVAAAPGFLGGWLGNESLHAYWTATVWESAAAMLAYRNAQSHMRAMPKLLDWCDEGAFTRWEQASAQVPAPDVAYDRMREAGRVSKVGRPSPAHAAGRAATGPAPRIGRTLRPRSQGAASA